MRALRGPRGERGMTLIEAMVALVVGAVIVAAVAAATLSGQRLALDVSARLSARRAVRTAAGVLRAELEAAPRAAGALVRLGADALTLRATRGVGIVCGVDSVRGQLLLDDRRRWELRAPDPTRDSLLVAADTATDVFARWRWVPVRFTSAGRGTCPDGAPAAALTLAAGVAAIPVGLSPGVPALVFETVEYRLYADGAGDWWLGTRSGSPTGWTATSPVAGPLRPVDGLAFSGLGAQSQPAGAESAAAIRVSVRARRLGGFAGVTADSLTILVALP